MPKEIIKHPGKRVLAVDPDKLHELEQWLSIEIEDSFATRKPLEAEWRELLRRYDGIPPTPVKNFPIENAPNIEVTIGAIAVDSIYAQVVDLIFGTTPLVTCRPVPKQSNDDETNAACKATQRFVNWIATNEVDVRFFTEEMVLDDIQLGSGFLYIPWIERIRKSKTAKILARKPKVIAMPPEDVIVSSGSYGEIDEIIMLGLRFWKTHNDIRQHAIHDNWDIEGFQAAGTKDWVRQRREILGKQFEGIVRKGDIYDVFDIYCYFDIDGDGIDEDLYCVYNHTGRSIGKLRYNPFDRRPVEAAVYQRRSHLFYGLGVLKMIQPYEDELTDLHNYQTLNILLANTRFWKGKHGSVPENFKIWPNRFLGMRDPDDLKPEVMADVYPSIFQAQMQVLQLAERRVGANELAPSAGGARGGIGNRTPGITALSVLQRENKRFTPAFDGIRNAVSGSLRQCLYRYQERILAGDTKVEEHIMSVLGLSDGQIFINLLREDSLDRNVTVELTASSASVNRESDKQNAIMLMNILIKYYTELIQLVVAVSSQQIPQEARPVIAQVIKASSEIMDRTIRTFDQVRDPGQFLIEVDLGGSINQAEQGVMDQFQGLVNQGVPNLQLPQLAPGGNA